MTQRKGGGQMNVSLRPELAQFLDHLVQCGQYRSAEEALNTAVELLKERENGEDQLERLLREAEDSGPAAEMVSDDWAEIEGEGLKRLQSRKSA
jgi:putative addiction module CopG family antidote